MRDINITYFKICKGISLSSLDGDLQHSNKKCRTPGHWFFPSSAKKKEAINEITKYPSSF